jgi:serine/threonine-protein kinase
MALSVGSRIGPYEVVSLLGVGGMGEVYRARDARLGRDVALKVLPDLFANDPERLARFHREAQVLAALNHPNIAAIHGLEEGAAEAGHHVRALVLELVEGETLADRLTRGPIPVHDALPIAQQIAEALEAAHEQGVIHRDLKPSNIKITPDGAIKVLDFGLAKLSDPAASGFSRPDATASPTITSPAAVTGVGTLLGTAAYMAPEQAKGRPADKRSDVWAFGCVLYEMLTGRRAFEGEDVSDTLAAVLRGEPDWAALPANVPPWITTLLRACVQRDRRKRPADVAAVAFVLDHGSELVAHAGPAAAPSSPRRSRTRLIAISSVAALAAVGLTLVAVRLTTPPPTPLPATRFEIGPPPGTVMPGANSIPRFAVSPDGRSIAFGAGPRGTGPFHLWIRRLDNVDAQVFSRTSNARDVGIQGIFWFADGRTIGFFDTLALKKIDLQSGNVQTLAEVPLNQFGGSANADGTIIYSSIGTNGILRISSTGGMPAQVTTLDSARHDLAHLWPRFLPDGRRFLYLSQPSEREQWAIYVGSLDSSERKLLVRSDSGAEFAPPDQVLYVRGDTLFTQTIDMDTLQMVGEPVLVAQPVFVTPQGRPGVSVSNTGVLVHATGDALFGGVGAVGVLTWVDRNGKEEPLGAPERSYSYPRLSPDGTRVAVDARDGENDVWVWDVGRKTLTRLTLGPSLDRSPVWTPDGRRIVFSSGSGLSRQSLYLVAADGTGAPERLTESIAAQAPTSITPDGTRVIFHEITPSGWEINALALDGNHRVQTLLKSTAPQRNGVISPDGRWIAYESLESGRSEIYVRPYPAVETGRWQVSTNGGARPVWARNGRELFYVSPDSALMAVRVEASESWVPGTPGELFKNPDLNIPEIFGLTYDISPDGRRFLVLKLVRKDETSDSARLLVVQNWFAELKRPVP